MKIGLFSVADHYPNEVSRTTGRLYEQLLEQVELADELGFNSFWIAEHHFHEYGAIPRPPIWMAAAAQRTRHIKLGSAVVVLPFDNPLRTAEDYAMVDVLSGGRLCMGVGSGYLQHEYDGFGVQSGTRRERFEEALEIVLKAWSGQRFSYHGRYHRVDNVRLNITPVQQPHPPVSIAILRGEAARFVGRKNLSIMMIPYASSERLQDLADAAAAFREGVAQAGNNNVGCRVRNAIHAYCASTDGEAETVGRQSLELYVRTRLYARQRSFDSLAKRDLIAVGSPETVSNVVQKYQEIGTDELLLITNFGALPHPNVLQSMRLIAENVIERVC